MIVTIVATWMLSALPLQDAAGEARGLIAEAKFTEASRVVSAALAEGSGDVRELTLLLAEAQAADGHAQKAIATLDTLGEVEDYDVALATGRAYIAWANELGAAGASDDDISVTLLDGKAHLQRAHALAPEGQTEAMAELGGLMLYGLTDHRGVQELVSPVLATDPEHGEALYLRGAAGTFDFWAALQSGDAAASLLAVRRELERVEGATHGR